MVVSAMRRGQQIMRAEPSVPPAQPAIASALHTLTCEANGLESLKRALENGLAEPFTRAVTLVQAAKGRVILTGIGKSGHVGQKIAATLASTGTPAYFVHPSEASHGDLGMITVDDVVIALSWSGETAELKNIINYTRRFSVPLVAITAHPESTLAKSSEIVLALPKADEACPHGLAPTTSTVMQLAVGDCLAVALLEGRGFTAQDFKVFHPGGQLGASLKFVSDVMHRGERLPLVTAETMMPEALLAMTEKSFGCLGIVDGAGRLAGIFTDGDLRRHMGPTLFEKAVGSVMTRRPKTVRPDVLASQALEIINSSSITALFVVEDGRPVGIVHIHDLLRIGVA
ncbi:MAG: KpsF/GutQ family sugar-phosphate isomerase [Rhizobiales bacterium]|nr:KpsF/GutQ family sugar-phosphate isomerase [Hyphomicrobiales bacterium]